MGRSKIRMTAEEAKQSEEFAKTLKVGDEVMLQTVQFGHTQLFCKVAAILEEGVSVEYTSGERKLFKNGFWTDSWQSFRLMPVDKELKEDYERLICAMAGVKYKKAG